MLLRSVAAPTMLGYQIQEHHGVTHTGATISHEVVEAKLDASTSRAVMVASEMTAKWLLLSMLISTGGPQSPLMLAPDNPERPIAQEIQQT